jgi:AraC-like DNA-binding protein
MTITVRAGALQGFEDLVQGLGADATALLRRFRISSAVLTEEDSLVSLRSFVRLLEASAVKTGCPDFGLRLSRRQGINVLGPLAIAMQNAATFREAAEYVSRHLFVHSPGLIMTSSEKSSLIDGASQFSVTLALDRSPPQRQTIDLCLGDMHHMNRLLGGERYRLLAVSLPHSPIAPLSVYHRFFGAPVFAEQPGAALHFSQETMDADLLGANPTLRQIAQDYLARHFSGPGESVTSRVRLVLRHGIGTSRNGKSDIASLLAIHPRTLQRHLAAEHTTFESIREEALKEVVLHYLRETSMPLGQLADLLGFSEQSAMTRSCRRWFGAPPSALRRVRQQPLE